MLFHVAPASFKKLRYDVPETFPSFPESIYRLNHEKNQHD